MGSVGFSYFCFFAIFGVMVPYLSPMLLDLGFTKEQAGLINGALYLCNTMIPILGGRLSDRFFSAEKVVQAGAVLMAVFAAGLLITHQEPVWFLICLMAFAISRAPLLPLQDTLAMQAAMSDPKAYAKQRVMGSLGFAVCVIVMGYCVGLFQLKVFFWILLATCIIFAAASWGLPKEKKLALPGESGRFWHLLNRSWWIWLAAMVCHWMALGPYHYGFTLLLDEAQIPAWLTGWVWSLAIASEIGFFLGAGWFFRRFSYRKVLLAALGANLLRWSLIALFPNPWTITLTQLLHGPGFALYYAAAISGIHYFCQGYRRASFQGLFSTCAGGLGSIVGTALAGWLHQKMPMAQVIGWMIPIELVALVLLAVNRLRQSETIKERGIDPQAAA